MGALRRMLMGNDDTATIDARERDTDPAPRMTAAVPLADNGFASAAGHIDNLIHGGCTGTVSVLYSKAGSTRASHFHREDSHHLYVVSGIVDYYERPVGSTEAPRHDRFRNGEMFYTPPMVEHVLKFPVDTVMVSISPKSRTHEEHEADVVRVRIDVP
jgi:uncharacterized RmlC-like cupin family protein